MQEEILFLFVRMGRKQCFYVDDADHIDCSSQFTREASPKCMPCSCLGIIVSCNFSAN